MNWHCTCNIVAIGYFIESVEVAKASGEHNTNNREHLFLCHVCDVQCWERYFKKVISYSYSLLVPKSH